MNQLTLGGRIALVSAALMSLTAGGAIVAHALGPRDSSAVQGAQAPGDPVQTNPVQVGGLKTDDAGVTRVNPWQVSPGGTGTVHQAPMCFSKTGCVEVSASAIGAITATATITAGTWYEIDSALPGFAAASLATIGCWDDTAAIANGNTCGGADASGCWDASAACSGEPKLKDGERVPKAFVSSPSTADAGAWSCPDAGQGACRWIPKPDAGRYLCPPVQTSCLTDAGCIALDAGGFGCRVDGGACTGNVDSGLAGCTWIQDPDGGSNYCSPTPDTGTSQCTWVPTAIGTTTTLRFFALTTAGLDVTLCPEVPCR